MIIHMHDFFVRHRNIQTSQTVYHRSHGTEIHRYIILDIQIHIRVYHIDRLNRAATKIRGITFTVNTVSILDLHLPAYRCPGKGIPAVLPWYRC